MHTNPCSPGVLGIAPIVIAQTSPKEKNTQPSDDAVTLAVLLSLGQAR